WLKKQMICDPERRLFRGRARLQFPKPVQHDLNLRRPGCTGRRLPDYPDAYESTVTQHVIGTRIRGISDSKSSWYRNRVRKRERRLRLHGNRNQLTWCRNVEKLSAIAGPQWSPASRDLIFRPIAWEWPDVCRALSLARASDLVCHPTAVRRKHSIWRKRRRRDI